MSEVTGLRGQRKLSGSSLLKATGKKKLYNLRVSENELWLPCKNFAWATTALVLWFFMKCWSQFLQNISILTFSTKVIWIGHNVLKQVLNLNFLSLGARLINPNFEGLTNIQMTFCPLRKYQLYRPNIYRDG